MHSRKTALWRKSSWGNWNNNRCLREWTRVNSSATIHRMSTVAYITSIKERLQLALLMVIFFPSFIGTFLAAIKTPADQIADIALNWSILIAIYLASYVVFDGLKKPGMKEGILRWLNRLVMLGIGFFVLPIGYLVAFAHTPATGAAWIIWTDKALFFLSMQGLQITAGVVLALSIIAVVHRNKTSTP